MDGARCGAEAKRHDASMLTSITFSTQVVFAGDFHARHRTKPEQAMADRADVLASPAYAALKTKVGSGDHRPRRAITVTFSFTNSSAYRRCGQWLLSQLGSWPLCPTWPSSLSTC